MVSLLHSVYNYSATIQLLPHGLLVSKLRTVQPSTPCGLTFRTPYKPPTPTLLLGSTQFLPMCHSLPHEYRHHMLFLSPRMKFFADVICEFSTICFRWIFQQYATPLLGFPNSVYFLLYFSVHSKPSKIHLYFH